jgi:hypothetical protein
VSSWTVKPIRDRAQDEANVSFPLRGEVGAESQSTTLNPVSTTAYRVMAGLDPAIHAFVSIPSTSS